MNLRILGDSFDMICVEYSIVYNLPGHALEVARRVNPVWLAGK
jgi:hypothetical protein